MKSWLFLLMCPLLFAQEPDKEARDKAFRKMLREMEECRVLYNDKKYVEAQQAFEKFLNDYGSSAKRALIDKEALRGAFLEAQLGITDSLAKQKKFDEAAAFAKRRTKGRQVDHVILANNFIWQRDRESAMTQIEEALKKDAKDYLAWFYKGQLQTMKREFEPAAESLEKAIEYNEHFAEAYFFLGQLYHRLRKKDLTRKYWGEYLTMVPRRGERFKYVDGTLRKLGGG